MKFGLSSVMVMLDTILRFHPFVSKSYIKTFSNDMEEEFGLGMEALSRKKQGLMQPNVSRNEQAGLSRGGQERNRNGGNQLNAVEYVSNFSTAAENA